MVYDSKFSFSFNIPFMYNIIQYMRAQNILPNDLPDYITYINFRAYV